MQLLAAGADPHMRGANSHLPLTLAALNRSNPESTSIVRALLEAGANPNAYSLGGVQIIHDACRAGGDGLTVKLLLQAGAGLNAPCPGEAFLTPLHIAARFNYAAAVNLLVNRDNCRINSQAAAPTRFVQRCTRVESINTPREGLWDTGWVDALATLSPREDHTSSFDVILD